MATRVNTRFVVILSSIILLIVMALVGVYVMKVMRSPEERVRRGEVFLAQGDLRSAADQFGRALAKRTDDLELIQKYGSVIARIPTRDHMEANTFVQQIMQTKRMASDLRPRDPELLDEYYALLEQVGAWQGLYDQASGKLDQYPDNLIARRYRGIANTRLINADMPLQRQKQAAEDLLAVYEQTPDDVEVAYHLALWNLKEADRLEAAAARAEEVKKHRDFAFELAKRMYEQDSDDVARQVRYVQVLLNPDINKLDEARPIVERLEAQLRADPDSEEAIGVVVDALPRLDTELVEREGKPTITRGLLRAQDVLAAAVEKRPENVLYRTMYGRLLAVLRENKAAIEQFAKAWDAGASKTPLDAVESQQLRIAAALQQLNLEVGETEALEDAQAREAELTRIEQRLAELEKLTGGTGAGHLIRGKVALARRQPDQAMQELRMATQQLTGNAHQLEALLLAARAYQLGNEPGAARDALEQVLQLNPGLGSVRLELAKLHTQLRDPDRAQQQIDLVLAQNPDDQQALALQAQLLAQQGKFDEAIAMFQRAGGGERSETLVGMAELQLRAGDRDEATRLLRERLVAAPGDMRALAMAVRLIDDGAERERLFAAASEAGANDALVSVLKQQASGEGDIDQQELIDQLLGQQEDPLRRALAEVTLYRRTGQPEKAAEALTRAAELNPDNREVIELQFADAIADDDWSRAEQLAARAGSLNLDLANGGFYRARLAAAQRRYDEAVAEYRRALSARPVYGEGWRQLGEVQLRTGNLDAAQDAFRRALEQQPNNVDAMRGLAAVADRRGEHASALRILRDAVQRSGSGELLQMYLGYEQQHGDPQRALELRRRLAEQNPRDGDNRRAIAILLASQEKHDEAIETLERLVADEGPTRQNVSTLASIHGMKSDVDAGRNVITQYIQSRGDEAEAADHLVLARYELATGNPDAAMQSYTRARSLEDPERRPITRELADLLFSSGRNEQAIPLYDELYAQDRDDPVVGLRYAEALMRAERPDDAQEIVARHPDSAQAKMLEAVLAMRQDDRAAAVKALERALQLAPRNSTALVQLATLLADEPAQRPRAKQLLLDAVRAAPESLEARVALAELHNRLGERGDAIRELGVALDQQPGNANLRLRLVDLHVANDNFAAAQTLLQQGQQLQPENANWPRLIARVAASRGRYADALAPAQRVVELTPTAEAVSTLAIYQIRADRPQAALDALAAHPEMLNAEPILQGVRGWGLAAAGQTAEAEQVFARAVERSQSLAQVAAVATHLVNAFGAEKATAQLAAAPTPANPLWVQLALADLQAKSGQVAEAARRLQDVASQVPAEPGPEKLMHLQLLGLTLYQSGQHAEARRAYEALLEIRPDDYGTLNNLAYLLVEDLDAAAEGLRLAERAAELAPDNAQVLDTLGWAQFKTNRLDAARRTLERSLRTEPLAPTAYHLARVYEAQGAIPQARQHASQAVDLAQKSGDDAVLSQARTLLEKLTQNAAAVRQ